ncbi:helix-turn-helix domain-containing protein [Actinoplanes palleronii]|uniref:HTH cro/C1-type domain-containing protein n=1 Tax=Actinoplanes palleronii TaxID=113570 RepID=A0ABQ4BJC3_9ACTN|nr:helix-turn-helix transcriptional regulator [Actinoplanes palleronii]GIE70753.1 hypothetical protein Apa02nite_068610 [Actinoplanes palleronii]
MTGQEPKRVYRLRDYDHAIAALNANRESRQISISKLAATVKAGRTEVSLWLLGKRKPAAQRLFDLAGALGYDLALIPKEDA